jgi:lycopene cyclase domain-containing protein
MRGRSIRARNFTEKHAARRIIGQTRRSGSLVTYGQFLVIFLVIPIIVLGVILRRDLTWGYARVVGLMGLIAFGYATPWDNLIVAQGVWSYDPDRVAGIILGWVPLEEYLFFLLQPILAGLIVLALLTRARRAAG